MSEAFNLDAVEADFAPFQFTLAGDTFEMPCLNGLPFDIAQRYQQSTEADALKLLLGDDQWERFTALSPTLAQVRALAEQWWEHQGITPPESLASKRS